MAANCARKHQAPANKNTEAPGHNVDLAIEAEIDWGASGTRGMELVAVKGLVGVRILVHTGDGGRMWDDF